MQISLQQLEPFKTICQRICINIPDSYEWSWDTMREMAVIVMHSEDAELVFFPLFKEFSNHWNFSSAPPETDAVKQYINEQFGLMPGQVVFTSYPLHNLVLCVAWWPWGDEQKVSMRVGLIPANASRLNNGAAFKCLSRWFKLAS